MHIVARIVAVAAVAVPLHAEVPAGSAAKLTNALAQVDSAAWRARTRGTLPRLSDPRDRPALEAFWDAPAIMGSPPYTTPDVPKLLDIYEVQNRVFKTYALYTANAAIQPDTARNGAVFQDEISRSEAFLLQTIAAELPAMADFVAHLPAGQLTDIRKQGLRQARLGLVEMVSGVVLALRSPGLRADNAARLTRALSENAAPIAQGLTMADRAAMTGLAQSTVPSGANWSNTPIGPFVTAMMNQACTGLCAIE